jgi:outer membrane protein OmpA-like peptidoglycan-associated protein
MSVPGTESRIFGLPTGRRIGASAMIRSIVWNTAFVMGCALCAAASAAEPGKDDPLVGRYEGSELVGFKDYGYDEADVFNGPINLAVRGKDAPGFLHLEGNIRLYYYKLPAGRSSLEVLRNYEASLKARGFTTVFSCATSNGSCYYNREGHVDVGTAPYDFALVYDDPELPHLEGDYIRNFFGENARYLLARLNRPEGTVHASLAIAEGNHGNFAFIRVIESKAMDTDKITVVSAGDMSKALADAGRISLYGIHFDFDQDAIKPESKPTLDEIARLLQGDPALRVAVVGHTDAKGSADYNADLSRRRAAAVVAALTRDYGIDASRLTSRGAGAGEPVATNDTDEGRARNRRVELVRQ